MRVENPVLKKKKQEEFDVLKARHPIIKLLYKICVKRNTITSLAQMA